MSFEEQKIDIDLAKADTDYARELEILGDEHPVYDSSLSDFDGYFDTTIPSKDRNILGYLDHNYAEKKGTLVGIELGGPGSKLFADLNGYFAKTAGFTLHKQENSPEVANHEIIEADVFYKRTNTGEDGLQGYQAITKWTKENGGADIIFERMVGGISFLDQEMFLSVAKRWYKLLNADGTMFLQTPILDTRSDLMLFANLRRYFSQQPHIEFDYADRTVTNLPFATMRLRKLPGSPESLD